VTSSRQDTHEGIESPTSNLAQIDPEMGMTGYVFPSWRSALADSQKRIADAYERRASLFRRAHEAGLSYREIGEATGLSAAAIGKVLGKQRRATLDDQANA
jgi:DNA-directed RNA polymerase specialized sigma24 family protein